MEWRAPNPRMVPHLRVRDHHDGGRLHHPRPGVPLDGIHPRRQLRSGPGGGSGQHELILYFFFSLGGLGGKLRKILLRALVSFFWFFSVVFERVSVADPRNISCFVLASKISISSV